jgi:hypothetical protein
MEVASVVREPPAGPAWMSTAIAALVGGPMHRGTVLTSTRLAAYILLGDTADPMVVAVVAPGAVRLPVAVCVPRLPAIKAGARAQVGGGVVTAGGHTWRPARWWDPSPRIDPHELGVHGHVLADVVESRPASAYGVQVDLAHAVVAALVAGDPLPACGLLGSGPGLTPAGDDVVAGALAALALTDRLDPDATAVITAAARVRTTALSAALITAAARGQVVPEAARTLRCVAHGDDVDAVAAAAAGLFAVGATSGHDLALGLAAALVRVNSIPVLEGT